MTTNQDSLKAIIQGLKDGGCTFTSNYPGFNSHLIHFGLGGKDVSHNEKLAFNRSYGASLSGRRSVISMKSSGLNACADQFLHTYITGVNAGLVIILTEDLDMESSPESQDSRSYRDIFGGLWLEPASVSDGYVFAYNSFDWSEKTDQPIVIRLTNNYFRLRGKFQRKEMKKPIGKLVKDRNKFLSWSGDKNILINKRKAVNLLVNKNKDVFVTLKKMDSAEGTIIFGSANDVPEDKSVLMIKSYPFPTKTIAQFLSQHQKLVVTESGNSYGATLIKKVLAPQNMKLISSSKASTSLKNFPRNYLQKLFRALKNNSITYIVGDEGLFTNELTGSIDACLCMGSSIGVVMGMAEAGIKKPFAITGDGNYLHGGITALYEARERGVSIGVIIIDNSGCQTTGGQKVVGNVLETLVPFNPVILDYKNTSKQNFSKVIKIAKNKPGVSVLVIKSKK